MSAPVRDIRLTSGVIEPPPLPADAAAGGVVEFHGVVRALEGAQTISGIDYEAHLDMARLQLERLVDETAARFAVRDVIVHHRIGYVPTAVPSLYVRVSASHRGPAFAAAQWLIDELKQRLPIWKHPIAASNGQAVPIVATPPAAALVVTESGA